MGADNGMGVIYSKNGKSFYTPQARLW